MARADPTNPQAQQDLAVAGAKVGDTELRTGDTVDAVSSYQQSLTIRQQLAQADPHNAQAQGDLSVAEQKLGEAQYGTGALADALTSYQQSLTILQQLAQTAPSNAQATQAVADLSNKVCWTGSLSGRASNVMTDCQRAVSLADANTVGQYRDSRGLARAMTGDASGAINDSAAYVEWSHRGNGDESLAGKRQGWIADLEVGNYPFDSATLEVLRSE
jgi:tetratricopeptide (TPR) repeat protein